MANFYKSVPKSLEENLEFRANLRRRAEKDEGFQRAMIQACREDVLFFINSQGWLFEPRARRDSKGRLLPKIIPFITWEHQDRAIIEVKHSLGFRDIGMEKARGEGASWTLVWFAVSDLVFTPMAAIGLVSKDENSVDNPEDPDSLMWKVGFAIDRLPPWMKPRIDRKVATHTISNLDNGSNITGYAATADVASGGRKLWFGMDELAKFRRGPDAEAMASTQHVTDSRLIISTPKGNDGEYFRVMHEPSNMVKIVLDWKDNPTRNRGLYMMKDGRPVAIDPVNNPLPPEYDPPSKEIVDLFSMLRHKGFKLEGRPRSPWYDNECNRPSATPQNIAQELDRDYGGSMHRVFGHDFMEVAGSAIKQRQPLVGNLILNKETMEVEFDREDSGIVKIWTELDSYGRPPARQYCCGADLSTGLGGSHTSNSVFTIIDMVTKEQVLEISSNTIQPGDFADLCVAACKLFWDAYLAWEHNGPGTAFTRRVKQLHYPNVYYRVHNFRKGRKRTKEMGWWTDDKTKESMFSDMYQAVRSGEVTVRSEKLYEEFGQYVRKNGAIEHNAVASAGDDAKGKAHGDRVIAFGVAIQAMNDRPLASQKLEGQFEMEPPPGTFAERHREYEENQKKEAGDGWDDRDNYDMGRRTSGGF